MTDKPTVFEAFNRVQSAVGAISKDKRVTEGPARFSFRGVDDVMGALHAPMADAGLICVPHVTDRTAETRQTRSGGTMNVVHLCVRFDFYGPDGSTFAAQAWGEGQDSGDKATGKAHSMAYKSALLQAFHIPVDDTPDADYDTTPAAPAATDTAWIDDFQHRVTLASSTTVLETLVAEARAVYAEGRLTVDDATFLKTVTDTRHGELIGQPA